MKALVTYVRALVTGIAEPRVGCHQSLHDLQSNLQSKMIVMVHNDIMGVLKGIIVNAWLHGSLGLNLGLAYQVFLKF